MSSSRVRQRHESAVEMAETLGLAAGIVDSLVVICIDYCLDNFHLLVDPRTERPWPHLFFSPLVSQSIFRRCKQRCAVMNVNRSYGGEQSVDVDRFMKLFSDPRQTPLNGHIDLSSSSVRDISPLVAQPARVLDFSFCPNVTIDQVDRTFKASHRSIVAVDVTGLVKSDPRSTAEEVEPDLLVFPNLQVLNIGGTDLRYGYVSKSIIPFLRHLTRIDLSCLDDVGTLAELLPLRNSLVSLVLFNVEPHNGPVVEKRFDNIQQLSKLRHLDISYYEHNALSISYGVKDLLFFLVTNLPELTSLDLSGTSLPDEQIEIEYNKKKHETLSQLPTSQASSIPALAILSSPLEFLGLLNSPSSGREKIPARRVTGNHNEQQLLESFVRYKRRKGFILETFHSLYQLLLDHSVTLPIQFLEAIVTCMRMYIDYIEIQVSGSASLFHLSSNDDYKPLLEQYHKSAIIQTCLAAMQKYKRNEGMQRNGCLVLFNFEIPNDMIEVYDEIVEQVLWIIENLSTMVSRIAVHLLNAMMGHADKKFKSRAQRLMVIEGLTSAIQMRLNNNSHDEVVDNSWSSLWNLTDETEVNCRRFIDLGGMELFLKCYTAFPAQEDLLRNMLGCLGNVAEVPHLRRFMLTPEYIDIFVNLLPCRAAGGIEVSYNACGILSHILSDGPSAWTLADPSRDSVRSAMTAAITSWDINSERNINYRSFGPILSLLREEVPCEAKYWAIWALTNLCTVYPDKYIDMLISEDGLALVNDVLPSAVSQDLPELANLAQDLLSRMAEYREEDACMY